jgi:flagellar protein FlbD
MIELTRLNGSRLAINCDLIKYAEAAPDTVLTLDYRAAVLRKAWPEAESALSAKSAYDADEHVRNHAHNASGE